MSPDRDRRGPRREAIVEIVTAARVGNQTELARRLKKRGFQVTQSSVSRDLRDLGIAKVGGRYVVPPAAGRSPERSLRDVARFLRGVAPAGPHLAVVTTAVGAAQTVALAIDHAGWPEVVGTVAGDDTLFVATAGAAGQRRLVHRLERIMT